MDADVQEFAQLWPYAAEVAQHLRESGVIVFCHPPEQTDRLSEGGEISVGRWRIEVRAQDRFFHGDPTSYPTEWVEIMSCKEWQQMQDSKPLSVVLVSKPTGAFVVVPGSTHGTWVHSDVDEGTGCVMQVERERLRPIEALLDFLRQDAALQEGNALVESGQADWIKR